MPQEHRKRRLADAADARLELEDVHAPAVIAEVSQWSRVLPWAAAAAAIAVAAFMLWNSPSSDAATFGSPEHVAAARMRKSPPRQ